MMDEALHNQIKDLPNLAGVYFFYNEEDTMIYVGKSNDIQSRVKQHFSGKDRKSIKIQTFTRRIFFEAMGSELIALLYESDLIKQHKPIYNRAQRRTVYQYGLYLDDSTLYKKLFIGKIDNSLTEITSFSSLAEAKNFLFRITEQYNLCQKINGLQKTKGSCFQFQIRECYGACLDRESASEYNQRVDAFLNKFVMKKFTKLFKVFGRSDEEQGIVSIENGVYKGFGFCSKSTPESELTKCVINRKDNKDVRRILMRYFINQPI